MEEYRGKNKSTKILIGDRNLIIGDPQTGKIKMDEEKKVDEMIETYIDTVRKKTNLIPTWAINNFACVFNYGNHELYCTDEESMQARQILKSHLDIRKLKAADRLCLFHVFAAYIHNLKDELVLLQDKNSARTKDGQQLVQIEISKDKKIQTFRGSKKKPKVIGELDPIVEKGAKELQKRLNQNLGEKTHTNKRTKSEKTIPNYVPKFVHKVAKELNWCLKKLMPQIKPNTIIRDLFEELELDKFDPKYCDIKLIHTYIERG